MDTIQSDKARAPLTTARRQALADFQEEMQQAGISVTPLDVTEVKLGLHESAEGITARPIYHISGPKKSTRLQGLLSLPHTDGGSGRFVKISSQRINMPSEANRLYDVAHSSAELDGSAVFLSTRLADSHLRTMLAIRVAEQWLELYRWSTSWSELGLSRLEVCQF